MAIACEPSGHRRPGDGRFLASAWRDGDQLGDRRCWLSELDRCCNMVFGPGSLERAGTETKAQPLRWPGRDLAPGDPVRPVPRLERDRTAHGRKLAAGRWNSRLLVR